MHSTTFLLESHAKKKAQIQKRLGEFKRFRREPVVWTFHQHTLALVPSQKSHHSRLFEELCFCILAANTSAELGMRTVDHARHLFDSASAERMTKHLKGVYRFINVRPQYIEHTREYLARSEFLLDELLDCFSDPFELRDFLANNTGIKGIGYKEASHFLRNVGFSDFAILDKHILNTLKEQRVISNAQQPSSAKQYLDREKKYFEFAHDLKMKPDELDLLLWSEKTGKILK